MKTIRELRDERAQMITQARAVLETADAEKRGLSIEEEARYNQIFADAEKIGAEIERREKLDAFESSLAQPVESGTKPTPQGQEPAKRGRENPVFERAFAKMLRSGFDALNAEERKSVDEVRALQADLDASGGYLMAPMQFVNRLIKAMDNLVWMRTNATVLQVTSSDSLGAPSLEADPADPAWTAEIGSASEDSTMSFGQRELTPHQLTKLVKVSRKLLRLTPDVEALVIQRLAYKFAVTLENVYLNGTGAGQPLGVFTASASGISTSRDVSTGNTSTAFTFDGLQEAKYAVAAQYRQGASWIFHRDGVKMAAKIKDGEGQYIWQMGVRGNEPDTLLGAPVFESEYAPNTFSGSAYVGLYGNLKNYWIADSLAFEVQRLVELYAANNQVGIIGRMESDGMPVLQAAFARVQLA